MVLPAPPRPALPQHRTGTGACQPGRRDAARGGVGDQAGHGREQARQHPVVLPERGRRHRWSRPSRSAATRSGKAPSPFATASRGGAGCGAARRVAEHGVDPGAEAVGVVHHRQAAGRAEALDDLGEVAGVRADGDGATEPGGLERVLAAAADQAAAHEHQRRQAVDQAQLAHGVADPEAAPPGHGRSCGVARRSAAAISAPRAGWRGATMVSRPGCAGARR